MIILLTPPLYLVGSFFHEVVFREEVQECVALHRWPQLWCLRDSRGRPVRLLLHWPEGLFDLVDPLLSETITP